MTCVLLSPWQPFIQPHGWSPMDPALPPQLPSDFAKPQYRYAASESESPQASNGSGKRRASRAGTRSVSTLSAAQLERKRANDRDAQRAIRQRTKDHIDSLEKTISDLRLAQEANDKLLAATQQQNREVLEENAYLRSKLREAGIVVDIVPHENPNRLETSPFPLQSGATGVQAAGSSNQAEDIASTPRSTLSLTTSQSSDSQQGAWQASQSSLIQSAPANLQTGPMMQTSSRMANWRPHGSLQNAQTTDLQLQTPSQNQSHIPYGTNVANQDTQWDTARQSHSYHGHQAHTQDRSNLHQQQNLQYASPVVPEYTPHATPHHGTYQSPAPPQAEFQSMAVASPVSYQMSEQHRVFSNPTQYNITPSEISPVVHNVEYAAGTAHMQPLLPLGQPYTPTQSEQQYTAQNPQSIPNHPYPPVTYPSQ